MTGLVSWCRLGEGSGVLDDEVIRNMCDDSQTAIDSLMICVGHALRDHSFNRSIVRKLAIPAMLVRRRLRISVRRVALHADFLERPWNRIRQPYSTRRPLGLPVQPFLLDEITSATAALACFPMYMIANSRLWLADGPPRAAILNFPGFESIREAFAIGQQEGAWEISAEHRQVLRALLDAPKPSDRATYEYALETLKYYLATAGPELADTIRNGVARMVVAVAKASGEGILGTGEFHESRGTHVHSPD